MLSGATCFADTVSNDPSGVAVARVLAYHPHHQKEGYSGNFFGVGVELVFIHTSNKYDSSVVNKK